MNSRFIRCQTAHFGFYGPVKSVCEQFSDESRSLLINGSEYYFTENKLVSKVIEKNADGEIISNSECFYDEQFRVAFVLEELFEKQFSSKYRVEYSYDKKGLLIQIDRYRIYADKNVKVEERTLFYDVHDLLIHERLLTANLHESQDVYNSYDNQKNLISQEEIRNEKPFLSYECTFDEQGNELECSNVFAGKRNSGFKKITRYNEHSLPVVTEHYQIIKAQLSPKPDEIFEYTYNAEHKLTGVIRLNASRFVLHKKTFSYDSGGLLTVSKEVESDPLISDSRETESLYLYDENKRLISVKKYILNAENPPVVFEEKSHEYDLHGNMIKDVLKKYADDRLIDTIVRSKNILYFK